MYAQINGDMNHASIISIKKEVQHSMKNNCLVSMNVNILPPKSLPRSEGKAVRVVDKRQEPVLL